MNDVIFSTSKPDIAAECERRFGVSWEKGFAIVMGKTIYSKHHLRRDVAVHELVHVKQQSEYKDPMDWWDRYFQDQRFRLAQEIEAYREQVKFLKENVKDRNTQYRAIRQLAIDLASPMYGSIISPQNALAMISTYA